MAVKKQDSINLIDNFSEFKEFKNIDRQTLINVLEDSFRNVITKMYGTDANYDVIINPDKGDLEIYRNRLVMEDDDVANENTQIGLTEALKLDDEAQVGDKVTDKVELFVPATQIEYSVKYPDAGKEICSMYKREALNGKDHYTVFFGGNYSRVDITTTANTERNLLVFKDSYANCMIQFLYPYFDHITMVDPRYFYDNVENIVTSEQVTDVLFLYNLDTFLSDTSLADVITVD